MFIPFNKASLSGLLPENRAEFIFTQPDLFMRFSEIITFYIYDDVVDKLDDKWKDKLTLWWGKIDFNTPDLDYDDEYYHNRVCSEYNYVDFAIIPDIKSLTKDEINVTPFAWDNNEIVIHSDFIKALKRAGSVDIWYDRLI
ncbi:hypothetical protein [Aliivibrio fischeri]|uniref:Uncharacterized protein n=1 Tax=Aliivibrio fischeri TaxID=668 RepID=A0A510UN65_ALIFS|nr:hypothetical protein [Aliivibrio fischeri]MUK51388.1 hypothetical protein [Aliivibrio fischeri]GEK16087.1 hypothetical protein AFI02nite_41230 [Aliivibrio fischeri]